jgi:flagellar hook assembly protein FlgD
VRTLTEGQRSAGIHRASWDGRDLLGNKVPSGVYFYRLEAPSFSSTKKMVVVR